MSSKVKKKVINFYEYIVSLYTEVEKFEVLVPVCVVLCVCGAVAEEQGEPWSGPISRVTCGLPGRALSGDIQESH